MNSRLVFFFVFFSVFIHFHTCLPSFEWRALGIFLDMLMLFSSISTREEDREERTRERENECFSFFFSCAQPTSYRFFATYSEEVCIAPIMSVTRTGRFIHFFSCYHSLSLSLFVCLCVSLSLAFSYFLFSGKRRMMRVIFHRSLFDIGQ